VTRASTTQQARQRPIRHRSTSSVCQAFTYVSMVAGVSAVVSAPVAHAEDIVTYDVFSDVIVVASGIEYADHSGRRLLQAVPLPWQTTATVVDAFSPTTNGAELRADWRPNARRYSYVTVRISLGGRVVCESRLDVGNATCYGSTPHRS
jgi:hypothetical protein